MRVCMARVLSVRCAGACLRATNAKDSPLTLALKRRKRGKTAGVETLQAHYRSAQMCFRSVPRVIRNRDRGSMASSAVPTSQRTRASAGERQCAPRAAALAPRRSLRCYEIVSPPDGTHLVAPHHSPPARTDRALRARQNGSTKTQQGQTVPTSEQHSPPSRLLCTGTRYLLCNRTRLTYEAPFRLR